MQSLGLIAACAHLNAGPLEPRLSICRARAHLCFRFQLAGQLMRDAWPLLISSMAVVLYVRIDQIMLGEMLDNEAVGHYAVAAKISELWYFLPMIVSSSVFPAIIKSRSQNKAGVFQVRMQSFSDFMVGMAYAIVIPTVLCADVLIRAIYGEAFVEAADILRVHMWAFVFVSMGVTRSRWLVAENLLVTSMLTAILGAVVNVGLNLLFIPSYGGVGAAWATLVSYGIAGYLSCLLFPRLFPVFGLLTRSLFLPFRLRAAVVGLREMLR